MRRRSSDIVIVGGGIGGIALAIALHRHGNDVMIVERSPRPLTMGSGLVLAANGVSALDRIDPALGQTLREIGRPIPANVPPTLLGPKGQPLPWSPYANSGDSSGTPTIPIMRADLLRLLSTAAIAAGVPIHYGHSVTGVESATDHALAHLADGNDIRGRAVVGADGLRSTVRASVVGDSPPHYLGLTSVRGVSPIPDRFTAGFITFGPGTQFFTTPVSSDQLYWVATMPAKPGQWPAATTQHVLSELTEHLAGWHYPIPALLATCDHNHLVVTDICDRDPITTWSKGNIVLLGDAAHPMAPTMGQGANTALEDAHCLAQALAEHSDVTSAINIYEQHRITPANTLLKRSRHIATMTTTDHSTTHQ